MKAIKRLIPLFLCLMMIAALSITAFAANTQANVYGELTATQVEVGEEFTFTLYNKEMTASAFKAGFYFDNTKLEVSKISFEDIMCYNEDEEDFVEADLLSKTTKKKANTDGSALGVYTFNSGVDSLCEEGVIVEVKFKAIAEGTATITLREETLGTSAFESDSVETLTVTIGTVAPECEHTSTKLVPNTDGTHNVVCTACNEPTNSNVTCTGSDDGDCTTAVECACGNVVTAAKDAHVAGADDGDCTTAVKCANCDQIATAAKDKHTGGTATCSKLAECSVCGKAYGDLDSENHAYGETVTGWYEIGGDWYYGEKKVCANNGEHIDHTPVTGLQRVPYNTQLGHGANADDKAYAEANSDSKYTDAESAVYYFAEDGKLIRTTGIVVDGETTRYAVDGVVAWHVGLVEVEGEYYYFAGDVNGGGNVMATGRIYATRNTTDLDITIGGVYIFGEDGKMTQNDGIVNIEGTLYYYEDGRLAIDAGLIEIDGSYYYVRSTGEKAGQLVVGREYWVSDTNDLLAAGMYEFDENGKVVIDPTRNANGIVEIDGVYYYYIGGVKQIGAGVVELTDEEGATFYIYVRSDGTLATGEYWPTTTNGLLERGCYDWGTDGKYYPAN